MAVEIEVDPVTEFYKEWEPQALLARKYKSRPPLPIRGGWGYSKEDAVVIDRAHPAAANFQPFNGVEVERIFIQLRLWEELIGIRPEGRQHSGCQFKLIKQSLVSGENGKRYDLMECDITALPDHVFEELKAEWEGPNGFRSQDFDEDDHLRRRDAAMVHYVGQYWFEISSFFGKYDDEGADDDPPVKMPAMPAPLM